MTRKLVSAGLMLAAFWAIISLVVNGGVLESAFGAACFSLVGHSPCDNPQSACNLKIPADDIVTGTCRAYRSTFANECAPTLSDGSIIIGELDFPIDGAASETWICTVQANLRITQGGTGGNWSFNTETDDLNKGNLLKKGSFGGSFGSLLIAANASDLRQISGMALGPQLGPFHGGELVDILVFGR